VATPPDPKNDRLVFGDSVRRAHAEHFDRCETTGSWSGIYANAFYRDLERHLVLAINPLFERIQAELDGDDRRRMTLLLECRQDYETDQLVSLFLQTLADTKAGPPAFGHLGEGRMGINDPQRWWQQLRLFQEAVLDEVLAA
jgi:hypothetical protein